MLKLTDIDFNAVWQETFGWNTDDKSGRKFDDQVESDFWVKLAPRYIEEYNLNHDTPLIAQRLQQLLGSGHSILEIGCGSGNFTALMARYSKSILGLDFSPAMLAVLQQRLLTEAIGNVQIQTGKWEDFTTYAAFDYIVSVNSLYRIRDMAAALHKMHAYSRRGFVIVRTIQRPFFYRLYRDCGLDYAECLDYQLLPLLLWQQGIQADVEFLNYTKDRSFNDLETVVQEMRNDLGSEVFTSQRDKLLSALEQQAAPVSDDYTISQPRTTVIISVKK
ncbi:MAG: class I SAM-dependent methyltransferase [Phascolarctobacterium sp.]|uniref:class I SAM-dependent methyltransferase n=1 Tax=Phascolarctobacterium sp. TaxID=2049039 RepID=UPI0025E553FF|nr:class I SAM-dependent methyltransferase [Phascolarctobacterium sp.]MCC8157869.1 class I SAM-dependent methyltransferase [Phascolarctobacterium sp.]